MALKNEEEIEKGRRHIRKWDSMSSDRGGIFFLRDKISKSLFIIRGLH